MNATALDKIEELVCASSNVRKVILFEPPHQLTKLSLKFDVSTTGAARMVGSGSSRKWFCYDRKSEEGEDGEEAAVECCYVCTASDSASFSRCATCLGNFCSTHVDDKTTHGVMCCLVETAKDPNKAFQYHEQKVKDFGKMPDRMSVKGMKRRAPGGEESTLVSSRSIEK